MDKHIGGHTFNGISLGDDKELSRHEKAWMKHKCLLLREASLKSLKLYYLNYTIFWKGKSLDTKRPVVDKCSGIEGEV